VELLIGDHERAHAADGSAGCAGYGAGVPAADLVLLDADGVEVAFDATEAAALLELTGGLEGATVSACPECRSRVLAVVALGDLLADAPPFPRSVELLELADDAPTLHVYVRDVARRCSHREWRDPGAEEWADVMAQVAGPSILR
jgi:hypothetical protein